MIKNLTGGSVLNYGPTLPAEGATSDGTLFYKTSGADQGLYLFGFNQDANPSQVGDQSVQGWNQVQFPGLYVDVTGDTMIGDLSMVGPNLSVNTNNVTGVNVTSPLSFINNGNFVWKKALSGGSTEMMRLTDAGILQLAQNGRWENVWHTGNDGAGSGLDADLLDGQNSTFFQSATNLTSGTLDLARLPFMPLQQGGGTGQGANKVQIGWSAGSRLFLQVDSTSFSDNWPINIQGRSTVATTADKATAADSATEATSTRFVHQNGSPTGIAMTFNWSPQPGQPNNVWGGNDGSNMYTYNPSNFRVAYADTAGTIPYNNVTGRPTQVSHLPNDAGYTAIPRGVIVMWSGALNAIPAGWLLCNGANGTPNLQDRFIVGAGASYGIGAYGGNVTATSSWNGDHTHGTSWYGGFVPTGSVAGTALTIAQMPSHQHKAFGESDTQWPYGAAGPKGQHGSGDSDWDNYFYLTEPVGGNEAHSHGLNMNAGGGHDHSTTTNGGHNHTMDVRPPYYALAFIMKA